MNRRIRMLLVLSLAGGWLLAQPARAQDPPPAKPRDLVQKVFTLRYGDVRQLAGLLNVFGVNMATDPASRSIAVNGPRENVAALEDAIKRLDVPPPALKSIELTIYMLLASPQSAAGGTLTADLEGVVKQMKGVFPYKGFRVLETFVLRTREREGGKTEGIVPAPSAPANSSEKALYRFEFHQASLISGENARIVRLDRMQFSLRVPIFNQKGDVTYQTSAIIADIDVREGQKVVVGKANVDGTDGALILVVTAKVVE